MSKRGLLLTVGTSHESEVFSVKQLQPDYVAFLCTDGEKADEAVNQICTLGEIPPGRYERFRFEDSASEFSRVIERARQAYQWLRRRCDGETGEIVANFTAGRKWMSAGLLVFLSRVQCRVVYVDVAYTDGQPIPGTMRIEDLGTTFARVWQFEAERGVNLFNSYQFYAAARTFRIASRQDASFSYEKLLNSLSGISTELSKWERFMHARPTNTGELANRDRITSQLKKHAETIQRVAKELDLSEYNAWATSISKLADDIQSVDPKRDILTATVDLYKNAERRSKMGQYDDAVARLYRCTEALVDYRLQECGCDPHTIHGLKCKVQRLHELSPESAADFLAADFLKEPPSDKGGLLFKPPVSDRNRSIIAHGWEAVSENCARSYLAWTCERLVKLGADPDDKFNVPRMPSPWL